MFKTAVFYILNYWTSPNQTISVRMEQL